MARFRFHSFHRRLPETTRASNGRVPAISARAPLDTLAQFKAQEPNSRRLSAEMTKFSFSTGLRISKNLAELARSPHHDAILVAPVLTLQLVFTFFLPFSSSLPLSLSSSLFTDDDSTHPITLQARREKCGSNGDVRQEGGKKRAR